MKKFSQEVIMITFLDKNDMIFRIFCLAIIEGQNEGQLKIIQKSDYK